MAEIQHWPFLLMLAPTVAISLCLSVLMVCVFLKQMNFPVGKQLLIFSFFYLLRGLAKTSPALSRALRRRFIENASINQIFDKNLHFLFFFISF